MKALNELTTHLQNISDSVRRTLILTPITNQEAHASVNEALKLVNDVKEEINEFDSLVNRMLDRVMEENKVLKEKVAQKDAQLETIKNLLK